jgi:hypothetical protein
LAADSVLGPLRRFVLIWWIGQYSQFSLFLGQQTKQGLPPRCILFGSKFPSEVLDVQSGNKTR